MVQGPEVIPFKAVKRSFIALYTVLPFTEATTYSGCDLCALKSRLEKNPFSSVPSLVVKLRARELIFR